MIYLQANTPNQSLFLTLEEGRLFFSTTYTDYLVELCNETTNQKLYFIANVVNVTDRFTEILVDTSIQDELNGCVLIQDGGRWNYSVYAQNSVVNLDPEDVSVVGLVEIGLLYVTTSDNYYIQPDIIIPEDIEYNG